tara:strand:- start:320 stop:622 length:303 start_codon:yes stop_codon:yes gene_type:complete
MSNEANSPDQQAISYDPQQVFDMFSQGVELFVQTATGIASAVQGIDSQGNLVTQSGQVVPPTTPIVIQAPTPQKENIFENPIVIIGLIVAGGLVLATALK